MSHDLGTSNKPQPVKAEVIARFMTGESKSSIARNLEITRPTVIRIIREANLDNFIETGKQDALQLIPKALEIIEQSLSSKDENVRLRAAGMILKGMGILNEKFIIEQPKQADVGNLPSYFGADTRSADRAN